MKRWFDLNICIISYMGVTVIVHCKSPQKYVYSMYFTQAAIVLMFLVLKHYNGIRFWRTTMNFYCTGHVVLYVS